MTPSIVLIVQPAVDFTTFLALCHQMLGYSPANAVDQSHLEHSDIERFLLSLGGLRNENSTVELTPNLLHFATYAALIAADDRDLIDIVGITAGMPILTAETQSRGVMVGFITGTLAQWRDAIKTGANRSNEHNVRAFFCKAHAQFIDAGLGSVWDEFNIKPMADKTFYLEDKRRG